MTDPIGSNRITTLLGGAGNGKGKVDAESSESRQGSGQKTSAESSQGRDHSDQLVLSSVAMGLNEQSRSMSQAIETPQQAKEAVTQLREALVSGAGGTEVHGNAIPGLVALLKQPA
ncbi:MAG: hypothetical protein GXP14_03200 [Gammaproteobacteria bacterium]|nr:hypothetical protein [Gammaproteobacteria bacterium]